MWSNHLTASVNGEVYENQVLHNSPGYPDVEGYVLSIEIKQVKRRPDKGQGYACNCVLWAQANGLQVSGYGAARNYPVFYKEPQAAGFVVTLEGPLGHMARYVRDGEWLIIDEANYIKCTVTYGRRLHISSPLIKGYL